MIFSKFFDFSFEGGKQKKEKKVDMFGVKKIENFLKF